MGFYRHRWNHDHLVFTRKRVSIGAKPHLCSETACRALAEKSFPEGDQDLP